jgi:sugar (pentulose or hexulose) kinase
LIDGRTIVLDVGKTHVKVSLLDEQGQRLATRTRVNQVRRARGYLALDLDGIAAWLLEALAEIAGRGPVKRIIPVGHGAAAAIVENDQLFAEPMDYEQAVGESARQAYRTERDDFRLTGSPLLPGALNLGLQLHLLEAIAGPLPAAARILLWPQFWAWHLGGVMATELTSLGCHSDLWQPLAPGFSKLAKRRGWAERMAPIRRADEALATLRPELVAATGLPADCAVLCGLHDSNAALLAMRGHAEMAARDATVLSTGTWFVAMRSLAPTAEFSMAQLDESRDCLVNVDVEGRAVPSARFMGGREAERIRAGESGGITSAASAAARTERRPTRESETPEALSARLTRLLAAGARAYPSFVAGVGPYPDAAGRLELPSDDPREREVMTSLYLALMSDVTLDLIGSQERLLVEGPFADDPLFVRALATLRGPQAVFTCEGRHDLAYGALRLLAPNLAPAASLNRIAPLDLDLAAVAADWRHEAQAAARVA